MSERRQGRHAGTGHRRIRVNDAIKSAQLRVVDADGVTLGVLTRRDALEQAVSRGVDLVEIAPQANPPVCKLVAYSKWCYEQDKAAKAKRASTHDTKEIQLGVRIGENDMAVKLRKAVEFLTDGDSVRIVIVFKGREIAHPELGDRVLKAVQSALDPVGRAQQAARREGRRITLTYQAR